MKGLPGFLIPTLVLAFAGVLIWVFADALAYEPIPRLAEVAAARVPESGVANPVTAVLLNFRGYDTLLELAVLLTALLGIWSSGAAAEGFRPAGSVLAAMVSWLTPLLILTAGYLLWVGGHAPGGAFQAGALLAAAGVLLALAGDDTAGLPEEPILRLLIVAGVAAFALVGAGAMAAGLGFLTYPLAVAKWLILFIETAATAAIGATLSAAFLGGRPRPRMGRGKRT
ncbi:MAG: MnhB domain-containing protein [Chromatiaceae bacterium]|jgi:multisubunit Na+/H+ antiporter MnhB subunit